jgi:hypothetical protein
MKPRTLDVAAGVNQRAARTNPLRPGFDRDSASSGRRTDDINRITAFDDQDHMRLAGCRAGKGPCCRGGIQFSLSRAAVQGGTSRVGTNCLQRV